MKIDEVFNALTAYNEAGAKLDISQCIFEVAISFFSEDDSRQVSDKALCTTKEGFYSYIKDMYDTRANDIIRHCEEDDWEFTGGIGVIHWTNPADEMLPLVYVRFLVTSYK